MTPAQALLIDEIAKKAISVRSVGEWILGQETLIREGRLLDVVMQHDRLTATLAALLERLGLERRARSVDVVAGPSCRRSMGSPRCRSCGTTARFSTHQGTTRRRASCTRRRSAAPCCRCRSVQARWTYSRLRELILDLFADFPFTSTKKTSLANMIALLLTPIVRPAIDGVVPLALVDKPKRGTGASLLAAIVQLSATGGETELTTAPKGDEEWRKKITSSLVSGANIMSFDNVDETLSSSQLAAALTAVEWQDRRLGHTENVRATNRATWIGTGNNLRLGGDLARRAYWIRLDAQVARTWRRTTFRHPRLRQYVRQHRAEILTALLTLARYWFVCGRPAANVSVVGGFEPWATTIGGILEAAGIPGFLGNLCELYDNVDDEEPEWVTFLAAWHAQYGTDPQTVATLVADLRAKDAPEEKPLAAAMPADLAEALQADGKKGSFARKLGKALAKRDQAVFGELRLERAKPDAGAHANQWRVLSAGSAEVPEVFSADPDRQFTPRDPEPAGNTSGTSGLPEQADREPGEDDGDEEGFRLPIVWWNRGAGGGRRNRLCRVSPKADSPGVGVRRPGAEDNVAAPTRRGDNRTEGDGMRHYLKEADELLRDVDAIWLDQYLAALGSTEDARDLQAPSFYHEKGFPADFVERITEDFQTVCRMIPSGPCSLPVIAFSRNTGACNRRRAIVTSAPSPRRESRHEGQAAKVQRPRRVGRSSTSTAAAPWASSR